VKPAEPKAAPEEPIAGCGVCGSSDVTYTVSTDVTGRTIKIGFCSVDCLIEKFRPTAVTRERPAKSKTARAANGS
jgi:hypothetical protein